MSKVLGRGLSLQRGGGSIDGGGPQILVFLVATLLLALVYLGWVLLVRRMVWTLDERTAVRLLVALTVLAVVAFCIAYPHFGAPANSSGVGDEDDALDLLARGFRGEDPYVERTYLGNLPTPLMGAGLLALPFTELFGSAGWQNPFWLVVGVAVIVRWQGPHFGLFFFVTVFSSLGFLEYFLVGGDYFISGGIATAAVYWFLHEARLGRGRLWAAASFLGVAGCTRVTTLPLIVVAVVLAAREERSRRVLVGSVVAAGVAGLLFLPWWVRHLGDFEPLQVGKIAGPPVVQALVSLLLAAGLLTICLSRLPLRQSGPLLALSNLPLLVSNPAALYRSTLFVWFGLPALAKALAAVDAQPRRSTSSPHDPPDGQSRRVG